VTDCCAHPEGHFDLCSSVLRAVNLGTIVLDADMRIVVWNQWIERTSFVPESEALGKPLAELFPELQTGRLTNAIQSAISHRLPSLLSQTLNKSPLPLYASLKDAEDRRRMQQAIQVIPINAPDAPVHCLIQITDVSLAVNRESILRQQTVELRSKTYVDGLTGIPNRRRFDEHAEEALRLAKRNNSPLSLIMIDIDFFKQYNDRYGHLTGDQCLLEIAQAIWKIPKRPLDMVARWGGEEFIALLPNTPLDGAKKIAEDMLAAVNQLGIPHSLSLTAEHVSISLGVATCLSARRTNHLNDIVRVADMALYEAKKAGRMRVACRTLDLDAAT
jgi:diguanylate cyclase (GGDEF)-like protein